MLTDRTLTIEVSGIMGAGFLPQLLQTLHDRVRSRFALLQPDGRRRPVIVRNGVAVPFNACDRYAGPSLRVSWPIPSVRPSAPTTALGAPGPGRWSEEAPNAPPMHHQRKP